MDHSFQSKARAQKSHRDRLPQIFKGIAVLLALLGLLVSTRRSHSDRNSVVAENQASTASKILHHPSPAIVQRFQAGSNASAATAEEIVSRKMLQFARSRRALARSMALKQGVTVPLEVEQFFEALESGNWPDIEARWIPLARQSGQYEKSTNSAPLNPVWSAVLDAYGVAEQVHEWPAQKLLDYGNAILESLRPGMVYVGGTDNGRWIPELLDETSGEEPHVIVTQNAMADTRYLDYMNTLYGDRIATLSEDDSKQAFASYTTDARKRFEHDQQFPEEPTQVRSNENLKMTDGNFEVAGQGAVMAINEKLLQALMAKNPDLQFAIQESVPLRGTYADAVPLGPLMELGSKDGPNSMTIERADQAIDYWQNRAQQLLADPEASASPYALKSYSHDTVSTGNLLAARGFQSEAEQAYRLASQLWPGNPESVAGLVDLLSQRGRPDEAKQLLDDFLRTHPDQRQNLEKISSVARQVDMPITPAPKP